MDRDGLSVVPEAVAPLDTTRSKAGERFHALRSVPFRWYIAGQVASASGTFVQQTAVGWLVLQVTGSAAALGSVLAIGGLPALLFGPWGGSIADRFDLRRLLIVTQAVYGLLALALWAAAVTGHAGVPLITAITLAGGIVGIVDSPARQAFVGVLVPPADLAGAVSLNGVVMNSARVVGPAVAGALIVAVGTTACFAVNAGSYLPVIIALGVIRPLSRPRHRPGGNGVAAAIRYARTRQQVWLPLAMMSIVGVLAFNFAVVLPVLAKQTFHGTGATYGLLSTFLSVGSVAGSLGVGLVRHPRRTYLIGTALAFAAALTATAVAPNVVVACVTLLLTGAAGFAFATLASTTIQLHSAPEYRGRILALWVFVFLGTTPIGSVLIGWISGTAGPRAALLVGAAGCLAAAFIAVRVRTPPNPDSALHDLVQT